MTQDLDYIIANIDNIDKIILRMWFFQLRLSANSFYGANSKPCEKAYNDYMRLRKAVIESGRYHEIVSM